VSDQGREGGREGGTDAGSQVCAIEWKCGGARRQVDATTTIYEDANGC